jgi:hypothetical protein
MLVSFYKPEIHFIKMLFRFVLLILLLYGMAKLYYQIKILELPYNLNGVCFFVCILMIWLFKFKYLWCYKEGNIEVVYEYNFVGYCTLIIKVDNLVKFKKRNWNKKHYKLLLEPSLKIDVNLDFSSKDAGCRLIKDGNTLSPDKL